MRDIDSEISSRVEAFVNELTALVRRAALEAVSAALGGSGDGLALPAKKVGRPKKGAAVAAAPVGKKSAAKAAKGPQVARRKPGAKRSPEEIEQTTTALLQTIHANPGNRIEEIARSLSTSTKDLTLPVKKLLSEKKITSKGTRRATKYYPR